MLYDNTIAIYVLLDDILQTIAHKEDKRRKVNDAMLMTTALISSWYFAGNWETARSYMQTHHCKQMLSKSRFNRRLHAIAHLCEQCFNLLGEVFKQSQFKHSYLLDTFPVAVCHNIPIRRSRLLGEEEYRGKNVSNRQYFYGYKVALLTTQAGLAVELAFMPGSYSEQSALARLAFDLPKGSIVWQDSGFRDYEFEDYYLQEEQIEFATQRKKNSLRGDDFATYIAKKQNRNRIETTFSEITARFAKKIHAVTIEGFQYKVFLTILAFGIHKYLSL
jgi:hypothetical protein